MINVEVIEDFNLKDFNKLENITRKNESKNEKGKLYKGDTFNCSKEMCEYLTGKNPIRKIVVKIIEIVPEDAKIEENASKNIQDADVQLKEEKKPRKKKSSKK